MLLHTGMYCMCKYPHVGIQASYTFIIVDVFTYAVYGYSLERCMVCTLSHLSWYAPQCTQIQQHQNMQDNKL